MKWFLIAGLVILLLLVITGFGNTQPYFCGIPMMGGSYGMMNYSYGGIIMWIIFLVIIGLVGFLILRNTGFKGFNDSNRETPLDILKKRYARGEITKEEFDKMKNDL